MANSGRQRDKHQGGADEIDGSLDRAGGARRSHGRKPDQRYAFHGVDVHLRPDHLEQPRDEIYLNARLPELANQWKELAVRILREGEDHAIDIVGLDQPGKLFHVAAHG